MRDELMNKILCLLAEYDIDTEKLKSRLYMVLAEYEVETRHTEIAVVQEDDITKYTKRFLIAKRVAGRTERTLKCYSDELTRFFGEVRKSPLDITSDDIKLYLAMKEIRDGVSKTYQKHMLMCISSFYTFMQKEEYITRNPMNKVEAIKAPKRRKEAFTEIQIEQLRMAADGDDRLSCIIEILLSTWCRVSELAQMKISDISEDGESILVHGKGRKDRICYLNARAKLKIKRYLNQRNDTSPYLFPGSNTGPRDGDWNFPEACKKAGVKQKDWWKAAELVADKRMDGSSIGALLRHLGKRAEVEKVHPHRFRRTGATFALRRGMPIEEVSKLLGHESIETTQIYLDISERELQRAHEKYV